MKLQIPTSPTERKELHAKLYKYAEDARSKGTTKGLQRFLQLFGNAQFEANLISWLLQYTPIRQCFRGSEGDWQFYVPLDIRKDYDLAGARLNPYYSIERPCPVQNPKVTVAVNPTHTDCRISDRQLATKALKLALNEFLEDGTREAKAKLLCKINEFPSKSESTRGSPFLQGGRADGNGRYAR